MDEKPNIESTANRDDEILGRIRRQIQEAETLIEAMKSKLPNNSQPNE